MTGPYSSIREACEAYAATLNREVPQERFLQTLHPDVIFSTKYQYIEGEISVVFYLETQWSWSIDDPWPLTSVTMPMRSRMADGELRHHCGLFLVERPDDIWEEIHLELKDGWVNRISVFAVRLGPRYPFPERVVELTNRLRDKAVPVTSVHSDDSGKA